ncbi:hypothetical protein BY458DRAFT_520422 [Sporodiniella umbellata]|nr:hypothetical protein BY458DRAFT_520422 [Sporodiniella umbellata]
MQKHIYCLWVGFVPWILGTMIVPTPGTVFKVGHTALAMFSENVQTNETVTLYFNNDRSTPLGGGPLSSTGSSFSFTISPSAIGMTDLVAVHRVNMYLSSVDSVPVQVVM